LKQIKFSEPDLSIKEFFSVAKVLSSGWLTTGKKVFEFEKLLNDYLHNEEDVSAIAVNSATAGLHLALEALGVKNGDEVITTVLTFTATAEVIRYLGANPVFCDIDPNTLNIDLNKVESLITEKTKAIIVVHFAGNPCNISKLKEIKKKFNVAILEDAAHALSSSFSNKLIGNHGLDATVFSFYANKTITSGGEGGMIIVKNKLLAKRIRIMSLHGIDKLPYDRFTNPKASSWDYDVIAPGYKYNLTDIAASIGIVQLKRLGKFHLKRIKIANFYDEVFSGMAVKLPPRPAVIADHSWHLYIIQLESSDIRSKIIDQFLKNNIGFSLHYKPLCLHSYWKKSYSLEPKEFTAAINYYRTALSIPIHTKMGFKDVVKISNLIKSVLG